MRNRFLQGGSIAAAGLALLVLGCAGEPVAGPGAPPGPPVAAPPPPRPYTVQDISTGPTDNSYAWSINADNQVAGWSLTASGVKGWVWAGGVITWLRIPRGMVGSEAYGISADGRVVGYVSDAAYHIYPAYWPSSTALPVVLPTLGNVTSNIALGVNTSGRVAGLVLDSHSHEQAFVWEASTGSFTLLGTLGGISSRANDVSETGTVTGCADDGAGNARAYRWTSAGGMTLADRYAGSTWSCGHGINRFDNIAGFFIGTTGSSDTTAIFDATGIPIAAARIGNLASWWAINDNGIAVGHIDYYSLGIRLALYYKPGTGIGGLPPLTTGGSAQARDISPCGRIVGSGNAGSGPDRALLWIPNGC